MGISMQGTNLSSPFQPATPSFVNFILPPSCTISLRHYPRMTTPTPSATQATTNTSPLNMLRYISSLSSAATSLSKSVPSSLTPQAENARSQATALWRSAKPWVDFLDTKKMNAPSSTSELRERLTDNLTHFSSNYVLCFLVIAVLSVLIHPLSFLCVVMLAILYVFMFLQNTDSVQIGPIRLSGNFKLAAFALVSVVSLYLTNAIGVIGSWAVFSIILSFLHAGCRASAKEPDFDSPVNPV